MKIESQRHNGSLGDKLRQISEPISVRIRTSPGYASTVGGQHLLWMLANLLARQYDVISSVKVAVPPVPIQDGVFSIGGGDNLQAALCSLIDEVGNGHIAAVAGPHGNVDLVEVTCETIEYGDWSAWGDGWVLAVGPSGTITPLLPNANAPFGPYFAACILAGEIFKSARQIRPERRRLDPLHFSIWDGVAAGTNNSGQGPDPRLTLPVTYLAGAGAVGQAFAATLIACREVQGRMIAIDHDAIDEQLTNLNRYILTVPNNKAANKADLLKRRMPSRFDVHAFPNTWEEYVRSPDATWADVQASEREGRYPFVISAVDTNPARHALQNIWPKIIYGASTLDLSVTVQRYDLARDDECLMCSNPLETPWTIEDQTAALMQLSVEERKARAAAVGADPNLIEQHVANPRCGTLAEAELQKFRASSASPNWTVGFVSVGAGVLLAARVIHDLLSSLPEQNAQRFSFEKNAFRASSHRPEPACRCMSVGRPFHARLWATPGDAK